MHKHNRLGYKRNAPCVWQLCMYCTDNKICRCCRCVIFQSHSLRCVCVFFFFLVAVVVVIVAVFLFCSSRSAIFITFYFVFISFVEAIEKWTKQNCHTWNNFSQKFFYINFGFVSFLLLFFLFFIFSTQVIIIIKANQKAHTHSNTCMQPSQAHRMWGK